MDFFGDDQNIDLRQELDDMLNGTNGQEKIGRWFILRIMRNDHCSCWDDRTGGARIECSICDGEGWLWDESMELMFMARGTAHVASFPTLKYPMHDLGYTDSNSALVFAPYYVFPDYERFSRPTRKQIDKLFEVKVDDDGNPVEPLVRVGEWRITEVLPMHGYNGRVEFLEVVLDKETTQ